MTVEELRAEAAALGYDIIKRPERYLPCICGHNRRKHGWYDKNGQLFATITCRTCGFVVKGIDPKHEQQRIRLWNEAIRKYNKK